MSHPLAIRPVESKPADLGVTAAFACVAWWALAAVSSNAIGLGLLLIGLAFPLLGLRFLPLILLSSFFFQSTMALPADWLYSLRVYWLGTYFLGLLATSNMRAPRAVWLWFGAGGTLLLWGAAVGALRVGDVEGVSRSSLVDGLASFVWLSCIFVGARFSRDLHGDTTHRALLVVISVWLVSVSYGLRQLLFGMGPDTVPPDIYTQVQGIAQYEILGRKTFAFLSSNGIAVVSVLPICIVLSLYRQRFTVVVGVLLLALAIWAMTLTRSFALLLLVMIVGLRPVFRVALPIWLFGLLMIAIGGGFLIVEIGLEPLAELVRFANFGDTTRSIIWTYTLDQLSTSDIIFGIGYGTASWEAFFTELYGSKVLQSPHSAALEFLGQFGVLGLAFYLVTVGVVVRWLLTDRNGTLGVWASATLALILLREQVAATYVFSPNFLSGLFWFVFGIAIGQRGLSSK